MINHGRSSDQVDPLLGYTLFPKIKVLLDPSKPYDFDHDLQAINNHLKSMVECSHTTFIFIDFLSLVPEIEFEFDLILHTMNFF